MENYLLHLLTFFVYQKSCVISNVHFSEEWNVLSFPIQGFFHDLPLLCSELRTIPIGEFQAVELPPMVDLQEVRNSSVIWGAGKSGKPKTKMEHTHVYPFIGKLWWTMLLDMLDWFCWILKFVVDKSPKSFLGDWDSFITNAFDIPMLSFKVNHENDQEIVSGKWRVLKYLEIIPQRH